MKGLQHKVIEINDTNNTEIEKILVFLKPGQQQINVANTRAQAQELLSQITVTKKKKTIPPFAKVAGIIGGLLLICIAIVVLLL